MTSSFPLDTELETRCPSDSSDPLDTRCSKSCSSQTHTCRPHNSRGIPERRRYRAVSRPSCPLRKSNPPCRNQTAKTTQARRNTRLEDKADTPITSPAASSCPTCRSDTNTPSQTEFRPSSKNREDTALESSCRSRNSSPAKIACTSPCRPHLDTCPPRKSLEPSFPMDTYGPSDNSTSESPCRRDNSFQPDKATSPLPSRS